jgi:hypothetical protein
MKHLIPIFGLLLALAGCEYLPTIATEPPSAELEPPAPEPVKRVVTVDDLRGIVRAYQAHGIDVGNLGEKGQGYLELACLTAAMVQTRFDAEAQAACTLAHAIGTEQGAIAPILAPDPDTRP